jgi:hypothetical protein
VGIPRGWRDFQAGRESLFSGFSNPHLFPRNFRVPLQGFDADSLRFGALSARAISRAGHSVYAGMRWTTGENIVDGKPAFSADNAVAFNHPMRREADSPVAASTKTTRGIGARLHEGEDVR